MGFLDMADKKCVPFIIYGRLFKGYFKNMLMLKDIKFPFKNIRNYWTSFEKYRYTFENSIFQDAPAISFIAKYKTF